MSMKFPSGSIYVHCDWHIGHALKLLLDDVFGPVGHGADIIWKRKTPRATLLLTGTFTTRFSTTARARTQLSTKSLFLSAKTHRRGAEDAEENPEFL